MISTERLICRTLGTLEGWLSLVLRRSISMIWLLCQSYSGIHGPGFESCVRIFRMIFCRRPSGEAF